jgi:hypothetical protein
MFNMGQRPGWTYTEGAYIELKKYLVHDDAECVHVDLAVVGLLLVRLRRHILPCTSHALTDCCCIIAIVV